MSAGVVIVGAGLAAQRCCEALRARGHDGPIRVIGDEAHRPYDRPPLSKGLLAGESEPESLALRPRDWYAEQDVDLLLGAPAASLDPGARVVRLAGGAGVPYDQLVIATGGAPRVLPVLRGLGNVHVLRTLDDALALRSELSAGSRLAVVGAGLVGLEVAATARRLGAEVTVVEAGPAPLAAVLGAPVGSWLSDLHAEEGAAVVCATQVRAVRGAGRAGALELADGRRVECDLVLAAVGIAPATAWLERSGLALERGAVATDAQGRTALPGVYAAGDAAGAGHWEAAARQGAAVAGAILGLPAAAPGIASFWSDQHGVRLQFAGTAAGHDRVEVDGDPAERDARALFLRRERPVGGLLLNRPRELPALRRLLHEAALSDHEPERNAA